MLLYAVGAVFRASLMVVSFYCAVAGAKEMSKWTWVLIPKESRGAFTLQVGSVVLTLSVALTLSVVVMLLFVLLLLMASVQYGGKGMKCSQACESEARLVCRKVEECGKLWKLRRRRALIVAQVR